MVDHKMPAVVAAGIFASVLASQSGFHRVFQTIGEELGGHSNRSGAALQVRRPRKSRASLEGFAVTIVFSFANGFALSSNHDEGFCHIPIARHFQQTVIPVMLSR